MKISRFVGEREAFVLERCAGRTCLHLGCLGEPVYVRSGEKLQVLTRSLHYQLAQVSQVVGVDFDAQTVKELQDAGRTDLGTLLSGDVEALSTVPLGGATFDVILAADVLEHLSNPGRMLEGILPRMRQDSELLITLPNAFALSSFSRYLLGRERIGTLGLTGADHVAAFSLGLLSNLLRRYGLQIVEAHTAYHAMSRRRTNPLLFRLLCAVFKVFPKTGGTLLVVAKKLPDEGDAPGKP